MQVGEIVITTAVLSTDLQRNTYMQANYPNAVVGEVYSFTNMTDAPANTALVTKITSTTWLSKIDYVKNT
jgi:hypothetical protein